MHARDNFGVNFVTSHKYFRDGTNLFDSMSGETEACEMYSGLKVMAVREAGL